MRSRAKSVLAAGVLGAMVGLSVGAAPAAAGVAGSGAASADELPILLRCLGNWPQGYQNYGDYWTCAECIAAGDAGLARGDWSEYVCRGLPIGLDYYYFLFIR
jgi:hypothetical protein